MRVGTVKLVDQPSGVEGWSGASATQVRTLEQPVATELPQLIMSISAQALPEPLTDVTGTVQFNRDRIQVEGVQVSSRRVMFRLGVIPPCPPVTGRS